MFSCCYKGEVTVDAKLSSETEDVKLSTDEDITQRKTPSSYISLQSIEVSLELNESEGTPVKDDQDYISQFFSIKSFTDLLHTGHAGDDVQTDNEVFSHVSQDKPASVLHDGSHLIDVNTIGEPANSSCMRNRNVENNTTLHSVSVQSTQNSEETCRPKERLANYSRHSAAMNLLCRFSDSSDDSEGEADLDKEYNAARDNKAFPGNQEPNSPSAGFSSPNRRSRSEILQSPGIRMISRCSESSDECDDGDDDVGTASGTDIDQFYLSSNVDDILDTRQAEALECEEIPGSYDPPQYESSSEEIPAEESSSVDEDDTLDDDSEDTTSPTISPPHGVFNTYYKASGVKLPANTSSSHTQLQSDGPSEGATASKDSCLVQDSSDTLTLDDAEHESTSTLPSLTGLMSLNPFTRKTNTSSSDRPEHGGATSTTSLPVPTSVSPRSRIAFLKMRSNVPVTVRRHHANTGNSTQASASELLPLATHQTECRDDQSQ